MDNHVEPKKKRGCGFWLLVGLAIFVGLGVISSIFGPTPEERAEMEAEREAKNAAVAESQKKAAKEWYDKLLLIGQPCDQAHATLSNQFAAMSVGRGDRYAAYQLASNAKEICQANWLAFSDLDESVIPEAAQDKAEEANETCKMIYFSKKQAAEQMMEFLDGDTRPSVIAEIKENANYAEQATLRCAAQALKALTASGYDLEELAKDSTSS